MNDHYDEEIRELEEGQLRMRESRSNGKGFTFDETEKRSRFMAWVISGIAGASIWLYAQSREIADTSKTVGLLSAEVKSMGKDVQSNQDAVYRSQRDVEKITDFLQTQITTNTKILQERTETVKQNSIMWNNYLNGVTNADAKRNREPP